MDGDGHFPHDFFSQTASSGGAAFPIDDDGWEETAPGLRGQTASGGRRIPMAGGQGAPRISLDLNTDFAAAASSYPNMTMYTNILHQGSTSGHSNPQQRARSDGVQQRPNRPPRQGLPPLRAVDRRGKDAALSGRADGGSSRSGSGRQRQAASMTVNDVGEEDEE
jgi:hypothetical protein